MENYSLKPDEVVLFEDDILIAGSKASSHLILTNINLVIISSAKKMFKKHEVSVFTVPVTDVKIYQGAPQVTQKKENITVYLTSCELNFSFLSTLKAVKFTGKITELITGKSAVARGSGKVKKAIGLVDDTLGINTMGTISGVLENGIVGTLFKGSGQKRKVDNASDTSNTITAIADATSTLINSASKKQGQLPLTTKVTQATNLTYEERVESVKKLKDLLDMGILSQEEFDAKKKELLEL